MSQDCSPLEYSWKWNAPGSQPEVRYSWEPYNPGQDSCVNPLNHKHSHEYMRDIKRVVPHVDFTLCQHFLDILEQGDQPTSNLLHAVDQPRSEGFDLKSYVTPRDFKIPVDRDSITKREWHEAIEKLNPDNASHKALKEFLETNPEGKLMSPL
jgi:hypothetical protein